MKISDVSKELSISPDTLRYYEKVNLIGPIEKINGIRKYSDYDLNRIIFVKCLRDAGVSIEALVEYISLLDKGKASEVRRLEILEDEYSRLSESAEKLMNAMTLLTIKIQNYKSNAN